MTRFVPSSDGVDVALHELGGSAGVGHPIVLIAHATGFHGPAYLPMAARLAPRYHAYAFDARGHGDTLAELDDDELVDWEHYGDDAQVVAQELRSEPGGEDGLVGFGHSKGGAALLMAADRSPDLFRLLVLFEPITFPPPAPGEPRPPSPLVEGARRRRATFPSVEAAIENFASKPPMNAFAPEALDAYVRYGVREDPAGVRLKCDPEREARTFEAGGNHGTWSRLAHIEVPCVVVGGIIDDDVGPASAAEAIADALPNGRFLYRPDLDHFGPFTHPAVVADLLATAITNQGDTPVVD